jgi:deazaflavin-dependent oxidoreductase (nitroreductase family)
MPVWSWLPKVNKHVFNKLELKRGKRPVIVHKGRKSGKIYQTPLDAHPIDGGYIFILMYSSGADWVKNVLASKEATLKVPSDEIDLESPKLLTKEEAQKILPISTKYPPEFLNVSEYMKMDVKK